MNTTNSFADVYNNAVNNNANEHFGITSCWFKTISFKMDENTALELIFDKRVLKDKKTKEVVKIFDRLIKASYIDLSRKDYMFAEFCLSSEYIQIFNGDITVNDPKLAGFKRYELDWKQYFILDNPRPYFHKKVLKLLLNKWKYIVDYATTMIDNDNAENCRIWIDVKFIANMLHETDVEPVIDVWINEDDRFKRNYMSWIKLFDPNKDDCLTPAQLKAKFEDVVIDLYDYIMWTISSVLKYSWHTVVWSNLSLNQQEFFKQYFEENDISNTVDEDFVDSLIDEGIFE